ncbi:hypothetical protein [Streptomyces sp. NPDC049555]|uniref:hypothetical protein n=1 Tax=unclassified Streptomyces TaxID=2593676 RepID=UPI00342B00AF
MRPSDDARPRPPDPAVLATLLARHGWHRRGGQPGRYTRWTPPAGPGAGTSLLVPDGRAYPDSADLLTEALAALEHSAAPSARAVLAALHRTADEIHWWREVPETRAPTTAWSAQEELRTGARALLLAAARTAAARAAGTPTGFHGARHRRRAEAVLAGLLTGPVDDGRELVVHLPLADAPPEGGRTLATTVLRALQAARDATDYRRATGRGDAFDAAVEAGVCRELTDALVMLVSGTQGVRIAVEWAPAAGPPPGFAARPEPVEFSPGDLPALREAGARYVRTEPPLPVHLTAAVVRLRREGPDGSGTVRLRVLAGAEVDRVRATLGEDDYRLAGHAHLAGVPVTVRGRLESRGGFRRLADAHDLLPARVDAAERDRLLKSLHSLHDNLDTD